MKLHNPNKVSDNGAHRMIKRAIVILIGFSICNSSEATEIKSNQSLSQIPVRNATTLDDAATAYSQGLEFLHGKGVEKDEKKAYDLFQSAAERGHTEALGSLGYFYSVGKVVEKDDAKARDYFEQAAEKGSGVAQMNLGRFLIDGRGGEKDPAKGIATIEKAIAQGSKTASIMLGEIYYWGEHANGVPDYASSFATLKSVAESGNAHAQNMIGVMIRDKRISGSDPETAREWFLKSANQGNAKACSNLGYWKYDSPDREVRIESLKWLLIAQHHKEVTAIYLLDDNRTLIKEDEMKEAQLLADAEIALLAKTK